MKITIAGRHTGARLRAAVVCLEGASAGDLRRSIAVARAYDRKAILVAVDGGLATCRAIRRRPELFVGDLDSTSAQPAGIPSRIYPTDKDFSDFAGALRELRRAKVDVVVVAGLLGGRLDHELANLTELGPAARNGAVILAPSARGLVVVTAGGIRVATTPGGLVSLFAVGGAARVTLGGTRWPLARKRLSPGSLGLSNRTGSVLRLTVHEGVAALVFPAASE